MSRQQSLRAPVTVLAALLAAELGPGTTATAAQTSTLVTIRAAHHDTFDRVVFEFAGPVPTDREVRLVSELVGDGSGLPVPVAGDAIVQVRLFPAVGHDDSGEVTYGATRRTYPLPNVIEVVNAGDFEAVLTFGIGLARPTGMRVFTLTNPSRLVIDIDTPFTTVPVSDYFLDQRRFETGQEPYVRPVTRPVVPPATARGALQRLFAGPTESELAAGLRFVDSGATGFTGLSIVDGIARVRLTGECGSGGSTFTIANLIMPTLRQFSTVRWVKIYDAAGTTENPTGNSDSIPVCLEP